MSTINTVGGDHLLTTHEAARRLRLAAVTLKTWRSTGRQALPFVKVGSRVRYREADLAAFIAQGAQHG